MISTKKSIKDDKYNFYMMNLKSQLKDIRSINGDSKIIRIYNEIISVIKNQPYNEGNYNLLFKKINLLILHNDYKNNNCDKDIVNNIQKICYTMLFNINMNDYFEKVSSLYEKNEDNDIDFKNYLINRNDAMNSLPIGQRKSKLTILIQKILGGLGLKTFLKNNLPNIGCDIMFHDTTNNEQLKIATARHPCPTYVPEGFIGSIKSVVRVIIAIISRFLPNIFLCYTNEKITPSYLEAIKHLEKNNERVLYVNLQRVNDNGKFENEGTRSNNLSKINNKNFHLLNQELDRDFFTKKGKYATTATFAELKNHIIDKYEEEEAGPVFDTVHKLFFGKKLNINENEYQQCILMFYVFQKFETLCKHEITHASSICKDDNDRGGVMKLIENMYRALITDKWSENEWKKEAAKHLLGPCFMNRTSGVIEHRLKLALPIYELFNSISKENIKLEMLQEHKFDGKYKLVG